MAVGRNVVVCIFDTLRSDFLGCYGGATDTPAFQSAADEGVVFESAFGTAPGTPVSHASLYSGRYPSEHGVTGQYISLPADVPVLAERFRDAGYDTVGVTGPSKMGSDWGYDRGFDELFEPYYDLPPRPALRSPARTVRDLGQSVRRSLTDPAYRRQFVRDLTRGGSERTRFKFDLLRERASELDGPFFLLCNFLTTHAPYDPPRPYKERATPALSRPRWAFLEFLSDEPAVFDDPEVRLDRVLNVQTADGVGRFLADPGYLNEREMSVLRDWYRATVAHLDDEFARFLEFYRAELRDDTVLVLTADHGEQLGEHGLWEHSHRFFDETLNVPLVVVGPGVPERRRRSDLVSHVDLFETLCDCCGIDAPATSGRSLFGDRRRDAVFMEYGERDGDDFATESGHGRYLDGDQLARFAAGRKAIRTADHRFEVTSLGTEHLYELPDEVPVEDPPPGLVAPLRERLFETLGTDFGTWPEGDPDDAALGRRVEENLRDLGYID